MFQRSFKWLNRDPVSYQPWYLKHLLQGQVKYFWHNWEMSRKRKHCFAFKDNEEMTKDTSIPYLSPHGEHSLNKTKYCTVLLLQNLANPLFVSIDCEEEIATIFFCHDGKHTADEDFSTEVFPKTYTCSHNALLINNSCFMFIWLTQNEAVTKGQKLPQFENLRELQIIFGATDSLFLPMFMKDLNYILSCVKCSMTYKYNKIRVENSESHALFVFTMAPQKVLFGDNVFQCENETFILVLLVCNGYSDCPDSDLDEEDCECNGQQRQRNKCKFISGNSRKRCSVFYLQSKSQHCQFVSFVHLENITSDPSKATISQESEMPEPNVFRNYFSYKNGSCQENGKLNCQLEQENFYVIDQICSYSLDEKGYLLPCKCGTHLQSCKEFTCNAQFKCPKFYCIPWSHVCDSRWDCPGGYDEAQLLSNRCSPKRSCKNMLKCRGTQQCVHFLDICDGKADCYNGDDEALCSLNDVSCPFSCQCLVYAMRCLRVSLTFLSSGVFPYQVLHIHFSNLTNLAEYQNVLLLSIRQNKLVNLCPQLNQMDKLTSIDAGLNSIESLQSDCFAKMAKVRIIVVDQNAIHFVGVDVFHFQTQLVLLNLTQNYIMCLQKVHVSHIQSLSIFAIEGNVGLELEFDTLSLINMRYVKGSVVGLYCGLPNGAQFDGTFPWYLSCEQLLPGTGVKISLKFFSVFLLVANILSILLQKVSHKMGFEKTAAFGSNVLALNTADMTCSLLLFILWHTDSQYQSAFVFSERQWRTHPSCFGIFGIAVNFGFLSPLLCSFLSLCRLMVVLFPIASRFSRTRFVVKCIGTLFLSILACSVSVTVLLKLNSGKAPFSLCFPLVDPTDSNTIISVLIWITTSVHFLTIPASVTMYCALIISLKKSQRKLQQTTSKKKSSSAIIVQIVLLTACCVICWIPSGIVFLVVMFMKQFSLQMVTWVTVAVVPLNSCVTPVIFMGLCVRKFCMTPESL